MKNNRLLFLCPTYPLTGGIETVTGLLVDFFVSRGYEVYIMASNRYKSAGINHEKHSGIVRFLEGEMNSTVNLDHIYKFIEEKDMACVFDQGAFTSISLNSERYKDVIFINTLHSCPFWEIKKFLGSTFMQLLKAEKTKEGKFKAALRYFISRLFPRFAFPSIKEYYRKSIDSSTFFVVLDNEYKRILQDKLYGGELNSKIVCIPNPVRFPGNSKFAKENKVIYVGRLTYADKRVDRLLRIWKIVQDEIPEWELLIIGDGSEMQNLRDMAVSMNLKNVSFKGSCSPDQYYMTASVLCLTSDYEGFGLVIPEAQSYGIVPVVFDCSPAISKIINNGKDGIIVDDFDEQAFAIEMISLIKDRRRLEDMQKKAILNSERFDVERIGNAWIELIRGQQD